MASTIAPPIGSPPSIFQRTYGALSAVAAWLWDNKPYVVGAITAATGAYQYSGRPVPLWLWFLYLAAGQAALHSSVKANTNGTNVQP